MAAITINGNTLESTTGGASFTRQPAALRAFASEVERTNAVFAKHTEATDASQSNYVLVQSTGPLSTHRKVELTNLGLVFHKYVSENTYLFGYKKTDLDVIRRLTHFVKWVDVYSPKFVIAPALKQPTGVPARLTAAAPSPAEGATTDQGAVGEEKQDVKDQSMLKVDVIVHRDVDSNDESVKKRILEAAHIDLEDKGRFEVSENKIRISLNTSDQLEDIAALDDVQLIQKVYPARLHNNVAREILKADVVGNTTPYKGSGQVIAVADTGFDKGKTDDTHPAFTGRVKKLYAFGRPEVFDDPNGHGTHVAGSVLGDGISADIITTDVGGGRKVYSKGGKIQGTAPQATLVLQSLMVGGVDDLHPPLAVPSDMEQLFLPPYLNDQARVHTNSWGSKWTGRQHNYNVQSKEIDNFVWHHPDMVILFSAGNEGSDQMLDTEERPIGNERADGVIDFGSVGQYASAKNCIAVGASENFREEMELEWGEGWPANFPKPPIAWDPVANNINDMAGFSSRGPTNSTQPAIQQRIKPDIVAPGTFILSARSRVPAKSTGWGTTSDGLWFWEGGTSMACPLVAGCAAVVRESLIKNGTSAPTAALVKALLVNGADPMGAEPTPNNNSGFGRVNLEQSVISPEAGSNMGFVEGAPLQQGAQHTYAVSRPSGSTTFKATLVWSDPAWEVLQNDLDLIVVASDGSERHGNMGTAMGFDRVNNVEQVVWVDLPRGDVTVRVKAFRIIDGPDTNDGPQPYALAWRFS